MFRIPIASATPPGDLLTRLEEAGLAVVSVEPDKAVVAFKNDEDLSSFRQAAQEYQRGPRINERTGQPFLSTKWDILEFIEPEGMHLWSKEDRIGFRLAERIGEQGQSIQPDELYKADVELWHPGSWPEAQGLLGELTTLVAASSGSPERILDVYLGRNVCLARVAVFGRKLAALLETNFVAEVELPPKPILIVREVEAATARDFPVPPMAPPDGPRLCILDSGVTGNHPLLRNNLGHAEAVLTAGGSTADLNGHGTLVSGVAVFGDVRAAYQRRQFASVVTLHSARVLNDRAEFDDEKLIIDQIKQAVQIFRSAPYNCRVFNLSLGGSSPALYKDGRQSAWSEALDIIARELKVLFVVPTGNTEYPFVQHPELADRVFDEYPDSLFYPKAKLTEPATAALALTVGSMVQHDVVAHDGQGDGNRQIARPMAFVDEPSPFTRTGPGVNGSIKPDFVDYGGNLVLRGTDGSRRIDMEEGTAIMSFHNEPLTKLFRFEIGSSLAAPRVARLAALCWHQLARDLGREPSPNLVRALMAVGAKVPESAINRLTPEPVDDAVLRACGYGRPDEMIVLKSGNDRVVMLAEDSLQLDCFDVYQVPVPPEFVQASGEKRINVALAFDPPVRRRRVPYLGIAMSFDLIRGRDLAGVVDAYRRLEPGEELGDVGGKIQLDPGVRLRKAGTLQRGTLRMVQAPRRDYGETYWLVVRAERKWAQSEIEQQDYAVCVQLTANDDRLYNLVRQRVQQRVRVQAGAEPPRARVGAPG